MACGRQRSTSRHDLTQAPPLGLCYSTALPLLPTNGAIIESQMTSTPAARAATTRMVGVLLIRCEARSAYRPVRLRNSRRVSILSISRYAASAFASFLCSAAAASSGSPLR